MTRAVKRLDSKRKRIAKEIKNTEYFQHSKAIFAGMKKEQPGQDGLVVLPNQSR